MVKKKTLRLELNNKNFEIAGRIIREGGLVSFPTETVYGLGADAINPDAVTSIYEAKGRPGDNPLIVHIASLKDIEEIAYIDEDRGLPREVICKLMDRFWPGPITFILRKKETIPDITSGGLSTVGIRMPESPVAREFIKVAGRPIAAPSANISGRPSPTTWQDVIEDMDGRIDAVLIGEPCSVGIESTVLDVTGDIATIVRPGFITPTMIRDITPVRYDKSLAKSPDDEDFKPIAPGMKYKHYAPKAKVRIARTRSVADKLYSSAKKEGKEAFIIDYENDSKRAAEDFFKRLRALDRKGAEIIFIVELFDSDFSYSVMNRMLKSAGYDVVE